MSTKDDPAGCLEPGSVVDRKFEVIDFVASGGMGFIYRATQLSSGREVALKIMRTYLGEDETSVERFRREAWTVSQLEHPNTVKMLEYGAGSDGFMYIAMEWLNGMNLSQIVRRHGTLKPSLAAWVGANVARALTEAHSKGIIHRDLKPENVILQQESETSRLVKVLDFGIAKIGQEGNQVTQITQVGTICGTPEYMSPEQARGEKLDGRSDVYGLGCLLFAVLTGRVPFEGKQPLHVLLGHLTKPFPTIPVGTPDPLAEIIIESTQKLRDERYASAADMARALEDFVLQSARYESGGPETPEDVRLGSIDHTIIVPLLELGLSPTSTFSAPDIDAVSNPGEVLQSAPTQLFDAPSVPPLNDPLETASTFKVRPDDNPALQPMGPEIASAPTKIMVAPIIPPKPVADAPGPLSSGVVPHVEPTLPTQQAFGSTVPHQPVPIRGGNAARTWLLVVLTTLLAALVVVLLVIALTM